MFSKKIKAGIFVVEGLNSAATTYYFYYLYFFMKEQFGFGAKENLLLAAFLGAVCAIGAIYGGKFAQRRGYFVALTLGFAVMAVATFAAGILFLLHGFFHSGFRGFEIALHILLAAIAMVGMCFTWATMQAIISEKEPTHRLRSLIGIYNLTWAGAGSVAYFTGGAMIQKFGLQSMFFVPGAIHLIQLGMTLRLQKAAGNLRELIVHEGAEPECAFAEEVSHGHLPKLTFLHMAWLANPFAYLAINTLIPIIPTLAKQLNFTPAFAGVFCSLWFFVRTSSFEILRRWGNWHYRFGWLATAFAAMIASFAVLLLSRTLWVLLVAQVIFGLSIGLIYYSSIFYSMDVGENKGEHGGFHEAMIGLGSCGGPAIGATALFFFSEYPESGAWAVTVLLLGGFAALLWMRFRKVSSLATA